MLRKYLSEPVLAGIACAATMQQVLGNRTLSLVLKRRSYGEDVLSLQEIGHLCDSKTTLRERHVAYLRRQQTLRNILADFTAGLLLEKPRNIFSSAAEHFAALASSNIGPPLLTGGSPALVIAGAKELQLLDILNRRFPKTFLAPIMTTTRPPRRKDRPGITMNFLSLEVLNSDHKAGKYLEVGKTAEPDSKGELIGTTLEAVACIKARGAIPLLHISCERAIVASMCNKIKPPPYKVLIYDDIQPPRDVVTSHFDTIIYEKEIESLLDALATTVKKFYPKCSSREHT